MRRMASVQIEILHQCSQHVPAGRMDECNVERMLQLEGNDVFLDQWSDQLCLVLNGNVVPDKVAFAAVLMEPHGQLVLGLELNILPGNALACPDRRWPATDAFDLHREVNCGRLSALREPTDGRKSRRDITRLKRVF